MDRLRSILMRQLERRRRVEPFVRRIVAGGLVLVFGLWISTLAPLGSVPTLLGFMLIVLGLAGLAAGLRRAIDYRFF